MTPETFIHANPDRAKQIAMSFLDGRICTISENLLDGKGPDADDIERGLLLLELPPTPRADAHIGRWEAHAEHLERKMREFIKKYARLKSVFPADVYRAMVLEEIDQEIGKSEDEAAAEARPEFERAISRVA